MDEEDFNIANPDELISSVTAPPSTEEAVQTPETFGELPSDQFFAGLSAATDGEIKDYAQFNELRGYKAKFTELQKRANELEAKAQIDPHASELTKALDEMTRHGASIDELGHFINLQKLNFAEMSDGEAIIMAKKLSLKGQLTDQELQEWYKHTYENVEDGEELSAVQKANRIETAQAARAELEKHKVDSGQPASIKQAQIRQQQFDQRAGMWDKVMSQTFGQAESQTFSAPIGKDDEGNDVMFDLNFPVPANVRMEISSHAAKFAAQNQFNGNQEEFEKVQEFCRQLLWTKMGPQIYAAGIRDAKSKTAEEIAQANHNVRPIGGDPKPKSKTEETKQAAKLANFMRKKGPFAR
ncbi:MAG: hypothetical protein K0U54_09980 [Bacteroidetes bacterium]|nr:hypothetical protein [Bacteroidota bacterium]